MRTKSEAAPAILAALLDEIGRMPARREASHCGTAFHVSAFDIYADCPACKKRIKVRSFGGAPEVEDVFDAVFAWMSKREARAAAEARIKAVQDD